MSVRIASRADITLEAVRRVAWEGEGVDLAPEALAPHGRDARELHGARRGAARRGPGGAHLRDDDRARRRRGGRADGRGAGAPAHAAVDRAHVRRAAARARRARDRPRAAGELRRRATPRCAARSRARWRAMLDAPLPEVPGRGQRRLGRDPRARPALLRPQRAHGPRSRRSAWRSSTARRARPPSSPTSRSPASARLALAEAVFALAVEAARAPLEAYSADLDDALGRRARDGRPARAARAARRAARRTARRTRGR